MTEAFLTSSGRQRHATRVSLPPVALCDRARCECEADHRKRAFTSDEHPKHGWQRHAYPTGCQVHQYTFECRCPSGSSPRREATLSFLCIAASVDKLAFWHGRPKVECKRCGLTITAQWTGLGAANYRLDVTQYRKLMDAWTQHYALSMWLHSSIGFSVP